MTAQILSLFTDENGQPREGFEKQAEIYTAKMKAKRGPYNKAPKEEVLNPYLELQRIQMQLAAFLPTDTPSILEQTEDTVFFCAGDKIKVYYEVYNGEPYEYEGETFTDEPEKIMLTELTGTETLHITDRLSLHNALLQFLCVGVELNKAVNDLQPKIEGLQEPKKELDRRLI